MTAQLYAVQAPPSLRELPASRWLRWLDGETRARILDQRNPQDAATRLCTRRLLLYAIRDACGVDAQSLKLARTPAGKPYFTGPGAPHFSLSHSGAAAFCAVHGAPVGADVERVRRVEPALARRVMSECELAAFKGSTDKDGFFFRIWTLKESYLKQTGQGIACELRSLSFTLEGDAVMFNVPGYTFGLYSLWDGYQAAACLAFGAPPAAVIMPTLDELDDF